MSYVLMIDDDEDFATSTARVLASVGHEVKIKLDLQGTIACMRERRPDLVILDVMFPENAIGGIKLAHAINNHGGDLRLVPILMLTADNSSFSPGFEADGIDRESLPVAAFIEKPVDFDVLVNMVSNLLENSLPRPQEAQ